MIVRTSFPLIALASVSIVSNSATSSSAFLNSPSSRGFESKQPMPLKSTPKDSEPTGAKSKGFWNTLETILFAPLEGIIEENSESDGDNDEDPRLVLAEWENAWEETIEIEHDQEILVEQRNATAAATAAEESLTNFLEVWAKITLQNDKGLTTPVSPTKFQKLETPGDITGGDGCPPNGSSSSSSMKLIFRPPKRYLSYKEQKSMEKNGVIPDRKGAKIDAWSPGGVEIQVTIDTSVIETDTGDKANQKSILGVTAIRCNIDGDTVIKKTSERAIVRRLENAIRIWKKSNRNKTR